MKTTSFKHCVLLPFVNNICKFKSSIDSVLMSEAKDDTLLVLAVSHVCKPYELEQELYSFLNDTQSKNVFVLYDLNFNNIIQNISAVMKRHKCDSLLLLREGERIDPYYLIYTDYYYNHKNNKEDCSIIFSNHPNASAIPPDGVCKLNQDYEVPLITSGLTIPFCLFLFDPPRFEAGLCALYKIAFQTVLQQGCYGKVNASIYTDEPYSLSLKELGELASLFKQEKISLPANLQEEINRRFMSQLQKAPSEIEEDADMLFPHVSFLTANDDTKPHVKIESVINYNTDAEIKGVAFFCDDVSKLQFNSDTDIVSSEAKKIILTYGDLIYPKIQFYVKTKLKDKKASCGVLYGRKKLPIDPGEDYYYNFQTRYEKYRLRIEQIAPRALYKISVIIPVYNKAAYLYEAVESVLNQSMDFLSNVQLILVDDESKDDSLRICREYESAYPYNITFVSLKHQGVSAARNHGLKRAMGKYILFLDADDKLEKDFLKTGYEYLENNNCINTLVFPICFFGSDGKAKETNSVRFIKSSRVDIEENYHYTQYSACGVMIRANLAKSFSFDEELHFGEDAAFMHKIILHDMCYSVLEKPRYMYRREDNIFSSTKGKANNELWYHKFQRFPALLTDHSLKYKGEVTKYTQRLILHDLLDAMTDAPVLNNYQFDTILESVKNALQYVDDVILMQAEVLPYWYRIFLWRVKTGKGLIIKQDGEDLFFLGENYTELLKPTIHIQAFHERNGILRITTHFDTIPGLDYSLILTHNEDELEPKEVDIAKEIYFLGRSVHTSIELQWEIEKAKGGIYFFLYTKNERILLPVSFSKKAGLSQEKGAFFVGENILLSYSAEQKGVYAEDRVASLLSEKIDFFVANMQSDIKNKASSILREYKQMLPLFSKSRIWLIMDNPQSEGANATFYRHCKDNRDGIDKYYIIDKKSMDGLMLANEGFSVIDYGSKSHALMYLFSEIVITSNPNEHSYNPLIRMNLNDTLSCFLNNEIIYIPSDIPAENISANLEEQGSSMRILLMSEKEICLLPESMKKKAAITGLPKYDTFENEDSHRLLFMPSWRPSLYKGEGVINNEFSSSEYCVKLCELLCNERLMDAVDKYDYRFCFAPHKNVFAQMDDIEMDGIVEVIPPSKASEALLKSCSLLITDSMPAAEYAWLGKPVLYYHFAEEEATQNPLYYFGKETNDLETLIDHLIIYMEQDCTLTKDDETRRNAYFHHIDRSNCERIYDYLQSIR